MATDINMEASPKAFSNSRWIIAFDFYDGPVSGVMHDLSTDRAWKFTMIDWDDNQEVRVFAMAPLPKDAFKIIADTLSQYEPQKSPFWFPLFNYSDDAIKREVNTKIDEAMERAGGVSHVIVVSRWGENILAETSVEKEGLPFIEPYDSPTADRTDRWLEFFGLERSPKK